jgi:hypothetical protein
LTQVVFDGHEGTVPSQLRSRAVAQFSTAPGFTARSRSLQSLPPQAMSRKPSPSMSGQIGVSSSLSPATASSSASKDQN